jgi:hypothetical protein
MHMQPFKFVVPKNELFASKLTPAQEMTGPLKCMSPLFQTPILGMRSISYTRPCRSIDDFFISNPDVDNEGKMTFPAVGMNFASITVVRSTLNNTKKIVYQILQDVHGLQLSLG